MVEVEEGELPGSLFEARSLSALSRLAVRTVRKVFLLSSSRHEMGRKWIVTGSCPSHLASYIILA